MGVVKTTLEIPDDLFREMKAAAALRGIRLRDFVTDAISGHLARLNLLASTRRILPIEEDTTALYAEIVADLRQRGCMIPINDVWIASLAQQHKLPVLSRDAHFDEVKNLRRVSW